MTTGDSAAPNSPDLKNEIASSGEVAVRNAAVGTPWRAMNSFANALLASSRAAALRGPTIGNPFASNRSTIPAASGASGPSPRGARLVNWYITMAKMCQDKTMRKVFIIGAGGREHAIIWALRKTSAEELKVFCAPGNAGIAQNSELINIPARPSLSVHDRGDSHRERKHP